MSRHLTGSFFGKGCPSKAALAIFPILLFILVFGSCKKESYPKPTAYPRISYPTAHYQVAQLPDVSFEYPSYATLQTNADGKSDWMNLRFGRFGATLHMSMTKAAFKDVDALIREKERLVFEQAPVSTDVRKEAFEADGQLFTGYFYLTEGNAPAPVQFLLTNHQGKLFQGSLIFDELLNRDSLATVVDGMTRDIRHLVETFQFKP